VQHRRRGKDQKKSERDTLNPKQHNISEYTIGSLEKPLTMIDYIHCFYFVCFYLVNPSGRSRILRWGILFLQLV
jgi:hypothetical protein